MEDIQKMIQEISQDVINTALLIAKEMTASKSLHKLLGEYKDCMECHIENDTLLI
jgi:mRNA-degrading endonuclease YafQ of YafQ-DinJ toxin-antitoxin module